MSGRGLGISGRRRGRHAALAFGTVVALVAFALAAAGCRERQAGSARDTPQLAESPPPALPPEATMLLARLEALRRQHREDEALALARNYLVEHPGTPRLHYAIGVLLGSKEDHRAAIEEFMAELAADPGHFESHLGMAAAHQRLGDPAAALVHLEACLAMRPVDSEARFQLGRVLSALGRFSEARPHLEAAAEELDDADAWTELGLLHRRDGDVNRAIDAFRRALERDAWHSTALLNLGQLLVRGGDTEEGAALLERHRERSLLDDRLDHLERSSRLAGATAVNFIALADAQLRAGDGAAAITSYRRALEKVPDSARAALGLASLLIERGEVEEATRWSVVAVMAAPDSSRTHYVLGMVRLTKGQYEEADRAFEASRRREAWDVGACLRVAEAYLRAGELERAARDIERAAATAPDEARVADLRRRLAAELAAETDR